MFEYLENLNNRLDTKKNIWKVVDNFDICWRKRKARKEKSNYKVFGGLENFSYHLDSEKGTVFKKWLKTLTLATENEIEKAYWSVRLRKTLENKNGICKMVDNIDTYNRDREGKQA